MKRAYKTYDAKLKAKVAIAALCGESNTLEICKEYNIPKANVFEWKSRLEEEAESIFRPEHEKKKEIKELEHKIEQLHRVLGQMTVELDFFKKKLQR